ncbi:MAG: nucleotidyltransferase domain-containing protein [Deltaproteobacteria bacterium]|jgi:predicted nucleotidyltransferase|nr:nucleotidyltransferase domain-containing protein [Deltaproteobacteria bacterium]
MNIILDDLKSHLLKNYDKSIKDIILFGSHISGNSKKYSDYDILIILDNYYSGNDENRILDLCYDINLKHNILLDIHLLSKSELGSIRGKQPVFINALKHGIYA